MNQSREELIFGLAVLKVGAERAKFLDAECAGDAALRKRLEALLAAHDAKDPFLETAEPKSVVQPAQTIKVELADAPDETIGQKIGRYKILEKIGEGGCGVVYVAEQTEPVRRRVALKVIKLGMDTKQVVARFEAERQALAMMDHPNIAKVLDAGATETGRPYFIMELVRGIRITDYCDQNKLPTGERVELFIKICQAIQHAHQKGIIHRDIKPSNILVTLHDGVPVPKVIDFGIAKATEGRLTEATVYTQLHQFIGTPAYMSPEQAEMSGLDIDTRSDIYSLGVLLYELLTGRTPFDVNELMSQGIDAMRKTIREQDPVRPSTKIATLQGDELTTTAKRRSVDRAKLLHQLQGDLDWIVMKCLEKDRTRRYETANGLAMDLKRHLANETVVARPPSKLYEFQRTVRRHKVGFAATAAIIIVLALGIVMTTWQAVRATHATKQALAAQAGESIQRQKAEANEQKALAAQRAEAEEELAARRRAYASDMNVAKEALDANNLGRALELLNRQRPQPGQKDLRGWEWRYLWQQSRSDALFTLCQQSNEIHSLAVSSDGNWLAAGAYHRGGVSLWDLRARREVVRLAEQEQSMHAAFSPTEPLLAFAGDKTSASSEWRFTLHLWNSTTRQKVADIPLDGPCRGLAFSKDGRRLVTSAARGHITLWSMPDRKMLASYPCEQFTVGPASGFAVTPDLALAAYGLMGGQVRVIDLQNGHALWTAVASKESLSVPAFSPDGKMLATAAAYSESDIRLWDVATGQQIGLLQGHGSWVSSLVFFPDGKKLASSSADQTIRIWDISTRQCLDVLRGHRQEIWRLASLPDGKTLVSGCKDGTICFWDTSLFHPRQPDITIPDTVIAWCFLPDNRSICTLDSWGLLLKWVGTGFERKVLLVNTGQNGAAPRSPTQNLFSPDGRLLASASVDGVVRVYGLPQYNLLCQVTNATGYTMPLELPTDGRRLATWSERDNLIHVWDLQAGLQIQSWQPPVPFSGAIAFSPDMQSSVGISYDGDAVLRTFAASRSTKLDLGAVEADSAAFSPDAKLFAVCSDMGFARVWDTANWKEKATLGGFLNGVHSVAFSPDSQRLATGSVGKEAVKLWDTESSQDTITLGGQGAVFFQTAFSSDGNTIGSMNSEGVLHLWHAPSWDEINAAEAKEKIPPQQL